MNSAAPRIAVGVLLILALVAYPLGIWFLLDNVGVLALGAVFVGVAAVRFRRVFRARPITRALLLLLGAVFLLALALTDSERLLKLYPVAINLGFLIAFAVSLANPPSMIERIARSAGTELSAPAVSYTRAVTMLWCGFFAVNATISAGLAMAGSLQAWALYTGLISYVIMGTLFLGEYCFRQFYKRRMRTAGGAGRVA